MVLLVVLVPLDIMEQLVINVLVTPLEELVVKEKLEMDLVLATLDIMVLLVVLVPLDIMEQLVKLVLVFQIILLDVLKENLEMDLVLAKQDFLD
jgi:hypothetical protein